MADRRDAQASVFCVCTCLPYLPKIRLFGLKPGLLLLVFLCAGVATFGLILSWDLTIKPLGPTRSFTWTHALLPLLTLLSLLVSRQEASWFVFSSVGIFPAFRLNATLHNQTFPWFVRSSSWMVGLCKMLKKTDKICRFSYFPWVWKPFSVKENCVCWLCIETHTPVPTEEKLISWANFALNLRRQARRKNLSPLLR